MTKSEEMSQRISEVNTHLCAINEHLREILKIPDDRKTETTAHFGANRPPAIGFDLSFRGSVISLVCAFGKTVEEVQEKFRKKLRQEYAYTKQPDLSEFEGMIEEDGK